MTRWKKLALGATTIVLVVAACIEILASALSGSCQNELIAEELSPDKLMKYVVFQRDCGSTTSFSTQMSVLPARDALQNEAGNVFSADTNHGAAPSGPGGGPEVRAIWLSDDHLQVQHHQAARIFRSAKVIDGIRIDYEAFN